jgi:hypothetical protein
VAAIVVGRSGRGAHYYYRTMAGDKRQDTKPRILRETRHALELAGAVARLMLEFNTFIDVSVRAGLGDGAGHEARRARGPREWVERRYPCVTKPAGRGLRAARGNLAAVGGRGGAARPGRDGSR